MAKTFDKLTRTAIRKLGCGEKLYEHGITFERLADGDGMFTVNIMADGQRIHRVVGRESEGTTRTQVEEFIAKVRTDAKHDRLALPKGRKLALSFAKAAEKYLLKQEQEGGKDLKMKRYRLNMHLTPFFGQKPLGKITTFEIERYKKSRAEAPAMRPNGPGGKPVFVGKIKPGTINRELAVLSHLLNKAVEWGWITHKPAKINRLRDNAGRITYLTVDQVVRLVEESKKDQNSQIYPFILIAVETSMRRSEIFSIRRENVDLEKRVIYIPKAKSGAREQPITAHLAEYLTGYLEALPKLVSWLFASPGAKGGHTVNLDKPFRRVVAAAGLDPKQVVRHTLRHTVITHLVQAGVDLPTVKRISGHKSLSMVERYSHQNGAHIEAAMDKLSDRYRKAS
jgi:integrase